MKGDTPGEFEQVVLLTLAGFRGEASGRQVYEALTSATGRDASVAAVHITLGRLAEKGWAERRTEEPAPGRGGKPRRRYRLAAEGARLMAEQKDRLDRLWDRAESHPLLADERG